jgi:hypothetical protein
MLLGEWRPRVKRQLRPHQPGLFDSAELRIELPACIGTREYSSKRSVRRGRRMAVARSLAHAGDIAMGGPGETVPAAVPRHARDGVAIRMLRSTRF